MVLTPASDENPVIVTTTKVMNQKSPYLPLLYTVGIGNSILSSMRPAKQITQPLQQRLRQRNRREGNKRQHMQDHTLHTLTITVVAALPL
jgi:hypothetical protein